MDEIKNLTINDVRFFSNRDSKEVVFSWDANIGFGELTFYKMNTDDKWHADTECMGKEFAQMVLNKWVDEMEIR